MELLSQQQIIEEFGNPFPFVRGDGTISPAWEDRQLAYAKLPAPLRLSWSPATKVTRFKCHRRLVPHFTQVMAMAFANQDVWATIGDFGGVYSWRAKRTNSRHMSTHAWGIAIDLDVAENPQGRQPNVHPLLIEMFENAGFAWGGHWGGNTVDGQHFEWCDLTKL